MNWELEDGDDEFDWSDLPVLRFEVENGDGTTSTLSPAEATAEVDYEAAREYQRATDQWRRFSTDYVFHNISNPSDSYDQFGFLEHDFSIQLDTITDAAGAGKDSIINTIGSDGMGIFLNLIKDDITEAGLEYDSEYKLYSAIQSFGSTMPGALGSSVQVSSAGWGKEYIYEPRYAADEIEGFGNKYRMLPGTGWNLETQALGAAREHIEQKYSSLAADIYQTMISREYVPNLIQNNVILENLDLKSSMGSEASPELEIDISAYTMEEDGE